MPRIRRISPPAPSAYRETSARLGPAWPLLALILAAGCASDPRRDGLSPHEFASVDHIAVYLGDDGPEHDYQVLDRIAGTSCNRSGLPRSHPRHKVVTEYEAIYDMKLEAADLGANAITGVACQHYGFSGRCDDSIVCEGDAVRLDDSVGMDLPLVAMSSLQAKAASADFAGNPALYESIIGFTPDYLTEAQRASLGDIGVSMPKRRPGRTVEAPPSGDTAMYQGAGLYFVQCAQGGTVGLIVSPLCAAVGAGLGAMSAESDENVEAAAAAIQSALVDYYSHEALRERMLRVADQSGARALTLLATPLPAKASTTPNAAARASYEVDSVIEVGVEELLLPAWRSGATTNLPTPVSVRTRVRVVRLTDLRELYNRSYGFTSDKRLFREWGADGAAALRHALEIGFEQIAERIIEDLLLAYPLMPGFAVTNTAPSQRNYTVEPLEPPLHQYWSAGAMHASAVASLEPGFRWREFPGQKVLNADFQGKLRRLSSLRYDLRIYRLDDERRTARIILERNNIEKTEYQLTEPLAPDTTYAWSVRARFELDTGERTSRWSGDWIGAGARGFLFETPR